MVDKVSAVPRRPGCAIFVSVQGWGWADFCVCFSGWFVLLRVTGLETHPWLYRCVICLSSLVVLYVL